MNAGAESYIIEQAGLRARLLAATAGFLPDEVDDARQDLLLDCLRRSARYDSARGDWDGFVRGVMRNHAAVLVARRCRRVRREVLAGDLVDPGSEIPEEAFFESLRPCDARAELDAPIDVRRALRQLPCQLQRLASLLGEMPIHDVCLRMGKSRSRVYQTDLPRAGRRSFPGNGVIRRDLPVVEAGGLLSTLYFSGS